MKRPSKIEKLEIKFNWLLPFGKFFLMCFFGKMWIKNRDKDRWEQKVKNGSAKYDENHEMMHVKQAVSTKDNWFLFYLYYIWYYLKNLPIINGFNMPYRMICFELEAYGNEYDLSYIDKCKDGAVNWKKYNSLTLKEKKALYKQYQASSLSFRNFIIKYINPKVGL